MIPFAELEERGLSRRTVNQIEKCLGFIYLEQFLEYAELNGGVRAALMQLPNIGEESVRNFFRIVGEFQPSDVLDSPAEGALAIPDVTECPAMGCVHSRDMMQQMVRRKDGELEPRTEKHKQSQSFVTICRFCKALCPSDALAGAGPPPVGREDPKKAPPVVISEGRFRRVI